MSYKCIDSESAHFMNSILAQQHILQLDNSHILYSDLTSIIFVGKVKTFNKVD